MKIFQFLKKHINVILALLVITFLIICASRGGDFDVYLFEALKLRNLQNVYEAPFYHNMPYTYSVLWVCILIPFTYLPHFITEFLWLLLNLFFLSRIVTLLQEWLEINTSIPQYKKHIWILSFALTIRFLLYNFQMIQVTIFLIYGVLEAIDQINKNKKLSGSLLLSLVMNIKLLPLAFLPYLFYRREFKAFFYTLLFFIIYLFVPVLLVGWEMNTKLLTSWWSAIDPTAPGRMFGEVGNGTVGLNALIPTLLMKTQGDFAFKRNLFQYSQHTTAIVLQASRLLLITVTLYFLKQPFKTFKNKLFLTWEISYILCILPLLAPQQQKYAFFFTFPAVVYTLFYLFHYKKYRKVETLKYRVLLVLLFIFFLLTTFTSDGIIGRYYNEIAQYYRTITYGGIVLAGTLLLCNPEEISPLKE